jgi:integrase
MKIYQRKQIWYVDCSFNGRRVRKRVGTSKKLALQIGREIEARLIKGEYSIEDDQHKETITFEEFCSEYMKYSKACKKPQTHRRDISIVNNLLRTFRNKPINGITAHDLEKYKMTRIGEAEPATVNRELTGIKHMFNKAVEWQYLKNNPLLIIKLLKEPPGRVRYLIEEEIEKLVTACADHLRPIVIIALHTGLRKSEILNLNWLDVDMANNVITVRKSKNNETRIIPINEVVFQTLSLLKNDGSCGFVFSGKNGKPLVDVKHSFASALKKACIKDFRFHDLRHTFASRLVMAGVDIRTVQVLMGHKDIKMTMRYSHLSDSHLREAVGRLVHGTNMAQAPDDTDNTSKKS